MFSFYVKFRFKEKGQGWGDGSVYKTYAAQAWDPEITLQHSCKNWAQWHVPVPKCHRLGNAINDTEHIFPVPDSAKLKVKVLVYLSSGKG